MDSRKTIDAWLVQEYKNGHKKALGLLVKYWHPKLCRQALWYVKDLHLAEDVVQEAWQVIINQIIRLRDPHQFGSWAYTIVTNKAKDALRLQQKERVKMTAYWKSEPGIGMEAEGDSKTIKLQWILKAIKTLPLEQQEVLNLFYLDAYHIKEIAQITGVTEPTVKTRLFRGREKIKELLKSRKHEQGNG
ncbi:RNA polymerase sigma factor [Sediminicola luteus]|uniref:RNA polymerase subunit sigma-70 n=1 Tax=Sediminicola luteus TaxID=319238 RepID=A0A2A4G1C7_9FLAO|nr:RNA polymerase sigma factor [Sediminicola luteus]PCE62497.1 hypothetical protein B7P33_17825 [Sediminicola luteus]